MIHRTLDTVFDEAPFSKGRKLVVALSGGADSTALLRALADHPRFGPKRLTAAHVNYGLRGKSSDADEQFTRRLCAALCVPLRVLRVRRRPGKIVSLQDWARRLRYAYFARTVRSAGAWGVATAHHLDDQAETVLDRLLRGSGLRGLSALRPVSRLQGLNLWRPLLAFRRVELETYLRGRGQTWRRDASNEKDGYRRNRIRHAVMPALKRFNPRLEEALAHLAETASAEDEYLDRLAASAFARLSRYRGRRERDLDAVSFARLHPSLQRRVVRLMAEGLNPDARGLNFERLEDARLVFLGRHAGPLDLGAGLSAFRRGRRGGFRRG